MRLIIVSNRLPVTLIRNNKNEFDTVSSAGGLVSGLKDYLDSLKNSKYEPKEYVWIGWPGISINPEQQPFVIKNILNDFNLSPVFFYEDLMENVYNGFCNKTIWPLFHYFPGYAVFDREFWDDYKKVNEIRLER